MLYLLIENLKANDIKQNFILSGEGWGMDSFEQKNYGKMLYLRMKSQKKTIVIFPALSNQQTFES